jgi:hypothetical protein
LGADKEVGRTINRQRLGIRQSGVEGEILDSGFDSTLSAFRVDVFVRPIIPG